MSSSTECGFWGSRVADLMESWKLDGIEAHEVQPHWIWTSVICTDVITWPITTKLNMSRLLLAILLTSIAFLASVFVHLILNYILLMKSSRPLGYGLGLYQGICCSCFKVIRVCMKHGWAWFNDTSLSCTFVLAPCVL
jgi:hypothetical protein